MKPLAGGIWNGIQCGGAGPGLALVGRLPGNECAGGRLVLLERFGRRQLLFILGPDHRSDDHGILGGRNSWSPAHSQSQLGHSRHGHRCSKRNAAIQRGCAADLGSSRICHINAMLGVDGHLGLAGVWVLVNLNHSGGIGRKAQDGQTEKYFQEHTERS